MTKELEDLRAESFEKFMVNVAAVATFHDRLVRDVSADKKEREAWLRALRKADSLASYHCVAVALFLRPELPAAKLFFKYPEKRSEIIQEILQEIEAQQDEADSSDLVSKLMDPLKPIGRQAWN